MEQRSGIISTRVGVGFIFPAVVFVLVFLIVPFFWVFLLGFTNQTLTGATAANPEFVGLQNYARLFDFSRWTRRGEFGSSLWITFQFVIGSALIGQAGLGLAIATIFHGRRGAVKSVVTVLVVVAWIVPEVVVAFAWQAFLNPDSGTLNSLLRLVGAPNPDWLFDYPVLSIIVFNTWRGTAFSMLLFASALETIPPSYLETADVVGASGWRKFVDIRLPLLRGHILTDLILITLFTFNTFTPFLLTGGGPSFKTNLLSIYTFQTAFRFFEFGKGGAIAMVIMLINLILALGYLAMIRRQRAVG
ncbi:MAG: carbohydrate ABC transporter permease [Alphaproteobacteria bacterium]